MFAKMKSDKRNYTGIVYVDTIANYYADSIFKTHKIKVKFAYELKQPLTGLVGVFCEIKTKDEDKFKTAMKELYNKMLICGYPEYEKQSIVLLQEISDLLQK